MSSWSTCGYGQCLLAVRFFHRFLLSQASSNSYTSVYFFAPLRIMFHLPSGIFLVLSNPWNAKQTLEHSWAFLCLPLFIPLPTVAPHARLRSQRKAIICLSGEHRLWQWNTWLLLMYSQGGQFCRFPLGLDRPHSSTPHLPSPKPHPSVLCQLPAHGRLWRVKVMRRRKWCESKTIVGFIVVQRFPVRIGQSIGSCQYVRVNSL